MIKQRKTSGGMLKWLILDLENPDMKNPKFYILFRDSSENIIYFSQINDSDYFLEPLINDYLNGWVKFISVDGDPTLI